MKPWRVNYFRVVLIQLVQTWVMDKINLQPKVDPDQVVKANSNNPNNWIMQIYKEIPMHSHGKEPMLQWRMLRSLIKI